MITFVTTEQKITEQKSPCYVFLLPEEFSSSADMKACEKLFDIDIEQYLQKNDFKGKLQQVCILTTLVKNTLHRVFFVGIGKAAKGKIIDIENYRRALGRAYRQVAVYKHETFALSLPSAKMFDIDAEMLGQETATILNMAAYHFDEYISEKDRKETEIQEVTFCVDGNDKKSVQRGIPTGECIAHAVNKARHWIDLPPTTLTPQALADKARAIAKKTKLDITVFSEKQINEMGMGGLAAVSRGSDLDCEMVILEYHAPKKNAPTIAFVGKGITFDSGGLSIKPANHMETMKEDMSGAAAVIATMEALAQLKPAVNVIGIAPIAENMPSGKATKPGDIVRFYNGKTAEIKNTDAEGRLILADALSYAVKHYKPDAIIDIATLTGACAYALGPFFTGLMSQHDELVDVVQESADRTGDRVWRLPLHDDYKIAVRSDVADLSNTGNAKYMAGAITAAHFLKNFVNDTPWVHLDIAGTAFDVPDISYYRSGATGASIRLLIDIAMHWK